MSQFGVIPKPHQPGKWRVIVDLTHRKGRSVNNGIEAELCYLRYTSVDEAVRRSLQMGRGHGTPSWILRWPIESYRTPRRKTSAWYGVGGRALHGHSTTFRP